MAKDVLHCVHSCVSERGGMSGLRSVSSFGGEDGIIIAHSRVLSMEGSKERKSSFFADL